MICVCVLDVCLEFSVISMIVSKDVHVFVFFRTHVCMVCVCVFAGVL